jgi:hypothetical protein
MRSKNKIEKKTPEEKTRQYFNPVLNNLSSVRKQPVSENIKQVKGIIPILKKVSVVNIFLYYNLKIIEKNRK